MVKAERGLVMLNEFLKVAYEKSTAQKEQEELISMMKELPVEELHKIAQSGEIKLANLCLDGDRSWLDQFKGTPFMEQAIGLEQESLQAEMANQQQRTVTSQRDQQFWAQQDQIRTKKKLLELQKAKSEMGTLQEAGVPVSGNLPGAEPPPGGESVKQAFIGAIAGGIAGHHKGKPHREPGEGAVRGAIGGEVGSQLGGLAGAEVGRRVARAMGAHPVSMKALHAAGVGGTVGAVGGGVGLYKALTHKYNKDKKHKKKHASADASGRLMAQNDIAKVAGLPSALRGKVDFPSSSNPGAQTGWVVHESPEIYERLRHNAMGRSRAFHLARAGTAAATADDFMGGPVEKAMIARGGSLKALANHDTTIPKIIGSKLKGLVGKFKGAQANELLATGDRAGRILAKTAGIGGTLLRMAERNPGMVIGGGLGVMHGALKEDGGLGSAIGEGLAGAAAGHAIGGIGGRMAKGKSLSEAAKSYGHQAKREGQLLAGHLGFKPEKPAAILPPAVAAGG